MTPRWRPPTVAAAAVGRWAPPLLSARATSSLRRRLKTNPGRLTEGRSISGSPWLGYPGDYHFDSFVISGYYDWRVLALAQSLVSPGNLIVEIGANVGTETVNLADMVGESGTVHAFEPFSVNADLLTLNLGRYDRRNVRVHRLAVSDRAGELRFRVPPASMSGVGHLLPEVPSGTDKSSGPFEMVKVRSLDSLTGSWGAVDLLICDAEGEEVRILRGGRETIERYRPPLILEAAPLWLRRSGSSALGLFDILSEMGYRSFEVRRFGLRALSRADAASATSTANWLSLPAPETASALRRVRREFYRCAWSPPVWRLNPLRGR